MNEFKVRELLLKIWSSETTIAVCFSQMSKILTDEFINFQDQAWKDSYQLHSEEVKSIGQLRNMLNLLSALIDISHSVFKMIYRLIVRCLTCIFKIFLIVMRLQLTAQVNI